MLSTKTNLEITEYHEKFFLGLSLRQLACFGVAAVLAIASCFVCLQWLQLDVQLMPDATSGGFLLDFCLYRYKIKPFIHHFSPLMAVVCPSETPSVLSGINRIQRWSQSKPLSLAFAALSASIYSVWTQEQRCHQE